MVSEDRSDSKLNAKQKILIVDDVKDNVRLLSLILAHQNYQIFQAYDGNTALAIAFEHLPDLVLLDWLMPEITGLEVCKRLKRNELTCNIPVIIISAVSGISEKVEAFSVGAVDYINKPFELSEVLARAETHLRLHRLQQEVELKTQQLQVALDQEKELSAMKSNFISVVSHEFRTPLTAIQSSTELLQHYEWSKEERTEQLQQILSQVDYMKDLMGDVLNLNESDSRRFQPEPTEIVKFWHCLVLEIFNRHRQTHDTRLVQEYAAEPIVMLDHRLLRLILNNLIGNAVKYSPSNSLISCRLGVEPRVERGTEPHIEIEVCDWGKGIPLEDRGKIFSSFYRGSNVSNAPGSGLGLAIAKQCVDLHQGKIRCQSEVKVGTTFTVSLPLIPAQNSA
jgi:two-component system, sensor histidine kinase and response regulator